MLISLVVDLRFTSPKIKDVESKDSVLRRNIEEKTAKSWADSWDLADLRLSPFLADVSILQERGVKVHGVTRGHDILTPDAILFREKCKIVGIDGEWLESDKQMQLSTYFYLPPA